EGRLVALQRQLAEQQSARSGTGLDASERVAHEAQIARLEAQLSALSESEARFQEAAARAARLEASLEAAGRRQRELEAQLEARREQLRGLQAASGTNDGRAAALERSVAQLEAQVARMESRLAQSQQAEAEAEAQLLQARTELTRREQTEGDLSAELAAMRPRAAHADALEEQLTAQLDRNTAMAAELAAAQSRLSALQLELQGSRERAPTIEGRMARGGDRAEARSRMVHLGGAARKAAELERALASHTGEDVATLRGREAQLTAQLQADRRRMEALEHQVQTLSHRLEEESARR